MHARCERSLTTMRTCAHSQPRLSSAACYVRHRPVCACGQSAREAALRGDGRRSCASKSVDVAALRRCTACGAAAARRRRCSDSSCRSSSSARALGGDTARRLGSRAAAPHRAPRRAPLRTRAGGWLPQAPRVVIRRVWQPCLARCLRLPCAAGVLTRIACGGHSLLVCSRVRSTRRADIRVEELLPLLRDALNGAWPARTLACERRLLASPLSRY